MKTQRIGLVQTDTDNDGQAPPRSPEREALADVLVKHAAIGAALRKNEVSQRRAQDAPLLAAARAVDQATEDLEAARIKDAEAVASGNATGAVKIARAALVDAEDELQSCRSAGLMLATAHADLSNRLALSRLNDAVGVVLRTDPATRELINQFRAAQARLFELREAMSAISSVNALPDEAKFWDAVNWAENLPPSRTAVPRQGMDRGTEARCRRCPEFYGWQHAGLKPFRVACRRACIAVAAAVRALGMPASRAGKRPANSRLRCG